MTTAKLVDVQPTVSIRQDGKFSRNDVYGLAEVLISQYGWISARYGLIAAAENEAAVACLSGMHNHARTWLERAEAIGRIE